MNISTFGDFEWKWCLSFLEDLASQLINLSLLLHGRNLLIRIIYSVDIIVTFQTKLRLWECQLLKKSNFARFSNLRETKKATPIHLWLRYKTWMSCPLFVFLTFFRTEAFSGCMFTLCDVEVDTVPENVQTELTETQCSDLLTFKFHAADVTRSTRNVSLNLITRKI